MGYTTQEFTSSALSNLYSSYYKEFQIVNWTHVDLVITEADGSQTLVHPATQSIADGQECLAIESRTCNGSRINQDLGSSGIPCSQSRDIPLKAKRIHIPFDQFRTAPVKIEEFKFYVSTVEQAEMARNMCNETNYAPVLYENRNDVSLTDPRLVFQIVDPNNVWGAIMVNVFGQTILLRAGYCNHMIPVDVPDSSEATIPDEGKLICYLRYPNNYSDYTRNLQTVFEIPLNLVYKNEPIKLPSGDIVCIAASMDCLQEVMAKKAEVLSGNVATPNGVVTNMVPKSVFDAAEKNYKEECERLKAEAKKRYDTLATNKAAEISDLQFKMKQLTNERDAANAKIKEWETLHGATTAVNISEQKLQQEIEKARKEAAENAQRDVENMWTVIKVGGGIIATLASFAVTMMIKNSSKK